jgi:hypothetical protein
MNKSLLVIICDFLLLSLLSLANFDKPIEDKNKPAPVNEVQGMTTSQSDLMDALQTALEEEQSTREELQSQLSETRNQVKTQEQLLAEREQNVQNLEQNLMSTAERAAMLERERQALDLQVTDTVRNLVDLEDQLNNANVKSQVSSAMLSSMQSELQMRERAAKQLQDKLAKVEDQQKATEQEKHQLALVLKETEVERNMVREQLVVTKEQVQQEKQEKEVIRQEKQVIQEEKAQIQKTASVLAEGVGALAEKSNELTVEIRENRPLSGNLIFSGFVSNRVDTEFSARKTGFLGQTGDTKSSKTVLVSSGGQIYALYHSQDTLLNLKSGETSWEYLYAHLRRNFALISMEKVAFLQSDPRIVLAPVTPEQAKEIGVKIYPLAGEPYKFNEAVLVGGSGDYYGESPFHIDAGAPSYVQMEKRRFSKFFGNFSPSRGDLVFSKTGEILGIMVNNEYCMVLSDLTAAGEVTLGPKIQNAQNARVLSNMAFRVGMLPNQVQ